LPDRICVFDVNETLLDLSALDPVFERIFGRAELRAPWFAQLLQLALTATVTGRYRPFGEHAMAALGMFAQLEGVELTDDHRQTVREAMASLPAHPDVRPALERLRDGGVRLATLTNSTQEVGERQVRGAGLRELFEAVLSADGVQRLKPAPEPYRFAAERLGVPLGEVRLVAAHDWDVAGALAVGAQAAFVARPGKVLDPLAPKPDIVVDDFGALADRLLAS
jgi:2-haloacid dehalogenase